MQGLFLLFLWLVPFPLGFMVLWNENLVHLCHFERINYGSSLALLLMGKVVDIFWNAET